MEFASNSASFLCAGQPVLWIVEKLTVPAHASDLPPLGRSGHSSNVARSIPAPGGLHVPWRIEDHGSEWAIVGKHRTDRLLLGGLLSFLTFLTGGEAGDMLRGLGPADDGCWARFDRRRGGRVDSLTRLSPVRELPREAAPRHP